MCLGAWTDIDIYPVACLSSRLFVKQVCTPMRSYIHAYVRIVLAQVHTYVQGVALTPRVVVCVCLPPGGDSESLSLGRPMVIAVSFETGL